MVSVARRRLIASLVALGAATSCAAPAITDVVSQEEQGTSRGTNGGTPPGRSLVNPNLIECPASGATSSTSIVGPLGGLVSVAGTSISIPAGALLAPVEVTVTVPASNLMEIDISVSGTEHFIFELPVVVTLSYARCTRNDINFKPLTAWYIDSETNEPLEHMGGIDNKLLRTVTFVTPHLSGYAVAN